MLYKYLFRLRSTTGKSKRTWLFLRWFWRILSGRSMFRQDWLVTRTSLWSIALSSWLQHQTFSWSIIIHASSTRLLIISIRYQWANQHELASCTYLSIEIRFVEINFRSIAHIYIALPWDFRSILIISSILVPEQPDAYTANLDDYFFSWSYKLAYVFFSSYLYTCIVCACTWN